MGDLRFAALVASAWLGEDLCFADLAKLTFRANRSHLSFPRRRESSEHLQQAFNQSGLDRIVKKYNDGRIPLVRFVEFGEDEDGDKDKSTYEMIRNDSGELIGIIVTDSKGRITLFTLYPAVGGTLVISIGYDNKDNETSRIPRQRWDSLH